MDMTNEINGIAAGTANGDFKTLTLTIQSIDRLFKEETAKAVNRNLTARNFPMGIGQTLLGQLSLDVKTKKETWLHGKRMRGLACFAGLIENAGKRKPTRFCTGGYSRTWLRALIAEA